MTTPLFEITEWTPNQNQPHVPMNKGFRIAECLSQLCVRTRQLNDAPTDFEDGDCYICNGTGTGDWSGASNDDVVMRISNTWEWRTPKVGWHAWLIDEAIEVRYLGSAGWDPST